MARLLPSALLTRAAVVLDGLGYDVERETDPEAGPILVATDPEVGVAVIVSAIDLGLALSGTLGLQAALPQPTLDTLVNACSVSAHLARFSALAPDAGEDADESVLFADAVYAGAFEGKSFGRFAEAFADDLYTALDIADEANLLLPAADGEEDAAAKPSAPAPKTGTGRLARGA